MREQMRPYRKVYKIFCFMSKKRNITNHGLIFIKGIGAHVKNTVSKRKDFLPHTSDRAPIRGALRNDSRPCQQKHQLMNYELDSNRSHTGRR